MSVQDKGGKAQPVPKLLPHPASGMALPIFSLSFWECSPVLAVLRLLLKYCLESVSYHKPNLYIHTNRQGDTQTVKSVSATAQVHTLVIVRLQIQIPCLSTGVRGWGE